MKLLAALLILCISAFSYNFIRAWDTSREISVNAVQDTLHKMHSTKQEILIESVTDPAPQHLVTERDVIANAEQYPAIEQKYIESHATVERTEADKLINL